MELRPAVPADAPAAARVHVRAWQAGYRGLMPAEYLDGLRPEDRAARYTFGRPDGPRTTVALLDGTLVGFATIHGECYGASTSLGISSRPHQDTALLRERIG